MLADHDISLCFLTFLRLESYKPLCFPVFSDFPDDDTHKPLFFFVFLDFPEVGRSQNVFLTSWGGQLTNHYVSLCFPAFLRFWNSQTIIFRCVSWLSWGWKLENYYTSFFSWLSWGWKLTSHSISSCSLTIVRLESSQTIIFLCVSGVSWGLKLTNHYISLCFLTILRLEARKLLYFLVFLDFPEAGSSQTILFLCVSWLSWGGKLANHYISFLFLDYPEVGSSQMSF